MNGLFGRRFALLDSGRGPVLGAAMCVVLAGAVPARAQVAGTLTPDEAVRLGLERNAQLRAGRADDIGPPVNLLPPAR